MDYMSDSNVKMRNACLKRSGAAHPPIDEFLRQVKERQKSLQEAAAAGGKDCVEPPVTLERPVF
jgi:hypothetical protein